MRDYLYRLWTEISSPLAEDVSEDEDSPSPTLEELYSRGQNELESLLRECGVKTDGNNRDTATDCLGDRWSLRG